jgi:ATP-dependent Clp protease ATP-binding subunit ClpA
MLRPSDGVLARFTRDLTADARAGRLEPIRARADEIARVIDILLRHGKNNPALVGPAGVGKTAIVEGLAQRVARGDVPFALRDVRVLALDHVSLLAGTTYRGQYEERISGLVEETSATEDVILFVDELHNLIGQGTAMGVAMDAANMLKPALVRGDFRVIGATTDDEYERWVCGDPALERRFQKVAVRELSAEETLEILRARKLRLERHHNVLIAEESLQAAVSLTDRYVTDRMRPDRAIDVLDEACAHAHAIAVYPDDVAALALERRALMRGRPLPPPPEPEGAEGAPEAPPADPDAPDDSLGFARGGFEALERFGAELEAMLAGGVQPDAARPRTSTGRASSPSRQAPEPGRLAQLDLALERRLAEAGIVVRGHDVARVVAVSTGRTVRWEEA